MWHAAYTNNILKHPTSGWELENDTYSIVWFDGQQMPDAVVPESSANDDSQDDEEYYTTDDDSDDSDSD